MSDLSQRLQNALGDRYRIDRELGRGGMASVLLADDPKHHRRVAIKVFDPVVAATIGPERFLREIETVAGLTHPHILPLHDSGVADGLLFYVMPYVEGESLRQRLEREKQLPLEDALRITREVADALGHAHGHHVVHRDIKPENILLEAGHAVVADFGIALAVTVAGARKLTASGIMMGTPAYMSPEQAAGSRELDGRSDIYSLGCTLYEMLAGQPPFTGPTVESIVFQHLNVEPPRVSAIRPSVPAGLEQAIRKAMAKSAADRFTTTSAFAAALTAEIVTAPPRRGHRVRWVATVTAGVALAVAALAAWQQWWPLEGPGTHRPGKKDWILVAEFDGPPGDSTLAPAAQSLLSAALDQSQIVATVPPDQVRQALRAAGKAANARVDADLAQELAYRSSVRAVLEGTIGRLGKGYSIVLKVVDADTPRVVLTRSGTAKDDDGLIPALGDMARQLRRGLGENREALKATRPMTQAATPSFEAYRLYAQGMEKVRRQFFSRGAIRYYRAALELDPAFASAWLAMAGPYFNLGRPDSARTCLDEASRRPERLTARQRNVIEILRASLDGDPQRALAGWDRILADDPGDLGALASANDYLCLLGRIEDALERTRRAIELSPFGPADTWIANEGRDLLLLGRFDEARENVRLQRSVLKDYDRAMIELSAGRFAVVESVATAHADDPALLDDIPEGLRELHAAARLGRGDGRGAAAMLQSVDEIYQRLHQPAWEDLSRRVCLQYSVVSNGVVPLPPGAALNDTLAAALLTRGLQAAVVGDTARARRCLEAARSRPRGELKSDRRCAILLEARLQAMAGRPGDAVQFLRPMGVGFFGQGVSLTWAHWWLADAFEQLGRPDSAAYYLERLPSIAFHPTDGALRPYVHWRLALLYARLGKLSDAERNLAAAEQAWDSPDAAVRRMIEEARAAVRSVRGVAHPERGRS